MRGYTLEIIKNYRYESDGSTYWTRDTAKEEAERVLKENGTADGVRIVPFDTYPREVELILPETTQSPPPETSLRKCNCCGFLKACDVVGQNIDGTPVYFCGKCQLPKPPPET